MVKVREDHPIREDGSVDLDLWMDRLTAMVDLENPSEVRKACDIAQQVYEQTAHPTTDEDESEKSTRPNSFITGLEMALILAELQQDQESIVAAILYRSVREDRLKLDSVQNQFGETIARMIDGVLQMAAIGSRANPRTEHEVLGSGARQLESVRKMLVAMIDDVRVALIKIAERTCAIRGVKNASRRKRYLVAREVFDIYAPLAHRLGIGHIKWELEDLSPRLSKS